MTEFVHEDWSFDLRCNNCGAFLDLSSNCSLVEHKCSRCAAKFKIFVNSIEHANSASMRQYLFRYRNDSEIEIRLFDNYPYEILEDAWQDLQLLQVGEVTPTKLLPIVKKYHDAIKVRIRRLLEVQPGKLTEQELRNVKEDPIKAPLNIKKLFEILISAYPTNFVIIDAFNKKNQALITSIWWVRNKEQHLHFTLWPLNAKIFHNLHNNPDDMAVPKDTLNKAFLEKVNNLTIDTYLLAESLYLGQPNQQNFPQVMIEHFRI